MNTIKTLESLDNTLSTIIDGAPEKGAKLVDWLYIQAPEVIQQLLAWHAVESGILALMSLALLIFAICMAYFGTTRFYAWMVRERGTEEPMFYFFIVVYNMIALVVASCNLVNITNNLVWLKIWIAPKVYLLEYLSGHLK